MPQADAGIPGNTLMLPSGNSSAWQKVGSVPAARVLAVVEAADVTDSMSLVV